MTQYLNYHEAEVTIQLGGEFNDALRERVEYIIAEMSERLANPEQFDDDALPFSGESNVVIRWIRPIEVTR